MMQILSVYLIAINLYGIYVMYLDKNKARHRQYRTPEAKLWRIAMLGGAIGTTIGMRWFHHKTKHTVFRLGFPILAIIDTVLFLLILWHQS